LGFALLGAISLEWQNIPSAELPNAEAIVVLGVQQNQLFTTPIGRYI
jgi:hypothetical protein